MKFDGFGDRFGDRFEIFVPALVPVNENIVDDTWGGGSDRSVMPMQVLALQC